MLRARREQPSDSCAAEQRDEPPSDSLDHLVGAQGNDSEIARLSALADLRLMISFECDGGHRQAMLDRSAL